MSSRSSASSALMMPSATASATPPATPAWAAPQVRSPCWESAIAALFTNRVSGLTGRFGRSTVTKAEWPGLGMASAVAHEALADFSGLHAAMVTGDRGRSPGRGQVTAGDELDHGLQVGRQRVVRLGERDEFPD